MNFKIKKLLEITMDSLILLGSAWLVWKGHIPLGVGALVIFSLYKTWPIKGHLVSIAKNFFVIKFFNVAIWFMSYIIAIKIISSSMGVSEEYLKFSPAIVAIPISIILTSVIVLIFCLLSMTATSIYQQLSHFLPVSLRGEIENSHGMLFLDRAPYLMFLLAIPLCISVAAIPFFLKFSILTDASFVSDCGLQTNKVVYLRKNNKECYIMALDRTLIDDNPLVVQKIKE